ncbi:hypothetical protein LV779_18155 [Streptomyces thinghirensis]|nr:hypothetical protein [Streptomyces thinghirensis]
MMFSMADSRIAEAVTKVERNAEFQAALNDPAVLANPANLSIVETVKGTGDINLDDTSFLLTADPRLHGPGGGRHRRGDERGLPGRRLRHADRFRPRLPAAQAGQADRGTAGGGPESESAAS